MPTSSNGRGANSSSCASGSAGRSAISAAKSPVREAREALRRSPRLGRAGALSGPPPARPEGLCAACPRGRVHRQGQSPCALRVHCKVSVATPATKPKGGQFVLHTKALHGTPFDGHTLGPVITELEQLTGVEPRRIHVDKGYRGHNHL